MTLKAYIITRSLLALPMTIFLLSVVFIIVRILPGNPIDLILGPHATPEMKTILAQRLGLDIPIYLQYLHYIAGVFQGNLGKSMHTGIPISQEILQYFPNTVVLAVAAMFVALAIGIPLGVLASQRFSKTEDIIVRLFGATVYVIPVFWLGMILQLVFGVYLRIFPVAGIGPLPSKSLTGLYILDFLLVGDLQGFAKSISYLVMPSFTLGLIISGVFMRLTRTYMVETMRQDYTVAAVSRGLRKQTIIYKYALRNALLPLVTMIGLEIAGLLAGAVLTEVTFSWPGLGTYLVSRIGLRDYPAVQGCIVFFAVIVIIVSFIVDLTYAYLDPRVRL
ncbi:MAG: ABC transporter permease [Nitrososphaerales archaeon]